MTKSTAAVLQQYSSSTPTVLKQYSNSTPTALHQYYNTTPWPTSLGTAPLPLALLHHHSIITPTVLHQYTLACQFLVLHHYHLPYGIATLNLLFGTGVGVMAG